MFGFPATIFTCNFSTAMQYTVVTNFLNEREWDISCQFMFMAYLKKVIIY